MASLVYGITPTDPLTLGTVCAVLLAVAVIGSYVPARRAMRVDPMTVLRQD
jgi:ABC-type lipoprotein release transport system permease subunit